MTTVPMLYEAVRRNNWVVLDTETTGLESPAEICQIAVIDQNGQTLLNTLVRPMNGISEGAYRVHGITDMHVANSPLWIDVRKDLLGIIAGKDLFSYNATFDRKMLHLSDEASGLSPFHYAGHSNWLCAMLAYAEFWGQVNHYYGSYKWQKLVHAMEQQGEMEIDAHSAWGDAAMTQWLVTHMAAVYGNKLSLRQLTGKDTGPDSPRK